MDRTRSVLLVSTSNKVLDSLSKAYKSRDIKVVRVTSEMALFYTLEHVNAFDAIIVDLPCFSLMINEIIRHLRIRLPRVPIIALYDTRNVSIAINALNRGVFDSLLYPFTTEDALHSLERVLTTWHPDFIPKSTNGYVATTRQNDTVIANSRPMQRAVQLAIAAAHTNAPVILTGDIGSGKEFLAQKIHQLSIRRHFSCTRVHCIKRDIMDLEHELFGQKLSEFPWNSHIINGILEETNHGTVFFDEITGIPRSIQVKLRDFLQNGDFEIPGTNARVTTDVRIIAATNKSLEKELQLNKIRKDFYFKINIISIKVPPLRERQEDIQELAQHFVKHFCQVYKKYISGIHPEAMEKLMKYNWPGNVRELRNYLERAVFSCKSDIIQLNDLPAILLERSNEKFINLRLSSPLINNVEEALIAQVLTETRGNVSKTANLLGISRGTLYSKIRKYGLEKETKSKKATFPS